MLQANKDPNVLIKEISKHCVHVRLTKRAFDGKDLATMSSFDVIQVFTPEEFELMEKRKNAGTLDWVKVSGFAEARVVHDGRLVPADEEEPETELEKSVTEVVKAAAAEAASKERKKRNVRANLNRAK